MRYVTFIALVLFGCESDYEVVDGPVDCFEVDGLYVVCPEAVDFDSAIRACDGYGGLAVAPATRELALVLGDVAASVGDRAWVGWPESYSCPAVDTRGAVGEVFCEKPLPVVCEL